MYDCVFEYILIMIFFSYYADEIIISKGIWVVSSCQTPTI